MKISKNQEGINRKIKGVFEIYLYQETGTNKTERKIQNGK